MIDINKQTCELLSILLNHANQRFAYSELAELMGVSARMIRNYLPAIEEFLAREGFEALSTFPSGEICFTGTRQQASVIRQAMFSEDFYSYKLSSEERMEIIILLLLGRSGAVTLNELSELLYVSKGTLSKDLESVEAELARMGAPLNPLKTRGYQLDIAEETRRDLLLQRIESLTDSSIPLLQTEHIYDYFIYETFRIRELLPTVQEAVKDAEDHFGGAWSDKSYRGLVLCVCIVVYRIMENGLIDSLSFDARRLQGSFYLDAACYLFSLLIGRLPIQVTDEEQFYLAKCLSQRGVYDEKDSDSEEQLHLNILTKSFLLNISEEMGIDIVHDPMLQSFLSNHIRGIMRREQRGEKDVQPYKEELRLQYPTYHQAIEHNIHIFQDELNVVYNEDQLSFILLHVVAAVERYFRKRGAPRVILVCNSGAGTANFLAEKLKRYFRLQVVTTVAAHRLEDLMNTVPYDAIISTVPLKIDPGGYVQISPMPTQDDMIAVQRALMDANVGGGRSGGWEQRYDGGVDCAQLLPLSHIALDCEAEDWRAAIRRAGELLLRQGLATEEYIDSMIRAVEETGPYIVYVNGVALAHAVPTPGFSGFCASLARLKEPVCFGHEQNDPVRYVVAIQISDAQAYVNQLIAIMDMMCDKTLRQALDQAATAEEAHRAVIRYDERTAD